MAPDYFPGAALMELDQQNVWLLCVLPWVPFDVVLCLHADTTLYCVPRALCDVLGCTCARMLLAPPGAPRLLHTHVVVSWWAMMWFLMPAQLSYHRPNALGDYSFSCITPTFYYTKDLNFCFGFPTNRIASSKHPDLPVWSVNDDDEALSPSSVLCLCLLMCLK